MPSQTLSARQRALVSTDIGGTDPDDFQSMVHLLVYADRFDIEGLISSPWGQGRASDILEVIDHYAQDYPALSSHGAPYPTPEALRAVTRQGTLNPANSDGFGTPSEGSDWIVCCARRVDTRPLQVLVWGGIEDLAQALHDAPDILPKLRVYFIGGPNKKWCVDAYHYLATQHRALWMIECNASYRGWFCGGNQAGPWDNTNFVARHIAPHGALGRYFAAQLGGTIKMGDTPSVARLLWGSPEHPSRPSWGGSFVRAWARPHVVFDRLTSTSDQIEQFGVFELRLPHGSGAPAQPRFSMEIENQSLIGQVLPDGTVRFRFCPKDAKTYHYVLRSNVASFDGWRGALTAFAVPAGRKARPCADLPNWWTDDPSPAVAEGGHMGAKTVSRWREQFLGDFAARMARCSRVPLSEVPATSA